MQQTFLGLNILEWTFVVIIIFVLLGIWSIIDSFIVRGKIRNLYNNADEITPEEFFKIRNTKMITNSKKNISTSQEFSGVYVLYNKSKDMYYVGQAKKIFTRVNQHFTGHGNGDVYADYKYGDQFTIRMIALDTSGFKTLNELERHAISTYNAKNKGYNKQRGNKG